MAHLLHLIPHLTNETRSLRRPAPPPSNSSRSLHLAQKLQVLALRNPDAVHLVESIVDGILLQLPPDDDQPGA